MKLKNVLFATMIACAFASCSNDDVPAPEQPQPEVEGQEGTFLDVRVQDPVSATKATGDPAEDEDGDIMTLTMVVFDNSDKIEAISSEEGATGETTGSEDNGKSRKVSVTGGPKKVLMVANHSIPEDCVGKSYGDLSAIVCDIAEENRKNGFSMNSKLYSVVVEFGKTNFLGYGSSYPTTEYSADNSVLKDGAEEGVKLYRNVAKVVLSSVTVTDDKGDFSNLGEPNVVIKDVFIANAKSLAHLVSTGKGLGHWESTEVVADSEPESFQWLAGVNKIQEWTVEDKFALSDSWVQKDFLKDDVSDDVEIGYYNKTEGTTLPLTTNAFKSPFYVYENGSTEKTLLVIRADVTYDDGDNGRATVADRYYTLAIGRTGFENVTVEGSSEETNGFSLPTGFPAESRVTSSGGINGAGSGRAFDVLRNLQYNVSLTITGIGYNQPGGGDPKKEVLDVKVRVVNWGEVEQNVTI